MVDGEGANTTGVEELGSAPFRRLRHWKAALDLCAEKGYRAIRDEEIAGRAGTFVEEFYQDFRDKRALFLTLLESVVQGLERKVLQICSGGSTAHEALLRLGNLLSTRLRRHPGLARTVVELYLVAYEDSAFRAVFQRYYSVLVREGTSVIERGIADGDLAATDNLPDLAWAVLTAADGQFIFNTVLGLESADERTESTVTDVLLCCLDCGGGTDEAHCALSHPGAAFWRNQGEHDVGKP